MTDLYQEKLISKLADELHCTEFQPRSFDDLPDKWIAKSLLQKAVRRNDLHSARRATEYLIDEDPKSFWRRLPIICWEDIGLVDLELCYLVDLISGSKRLRTKLSDDGRLALHVVTKMCAALKDRSSDDLLTLLEHDIVAKVQPMSLANKHRVSIEIDDSIVHPASNLTGRFSNAKPHDDQIQELLGYVVDDPQAAAIFLGGYKRTSSLMPLMSAIIWSSWKAEEPGFSKSDDFGHDYEIASIPRYAFDGNTRAGRRYLQWLSSMDDDLGEFLIHIGPNRIQQMLVRKLFFRTKSSLVADRVDWNVGNELRRRADQVGYGLSVDQFEEGKKLLAIAMLRYPMSEEHL